MGRFEDITSDVMTNRFRAGQEQIVKKWVQAEYAYVWGFNDFSFKHVTALENPLAVVAGERSPVLPTDFADAETLYNDQGGELMPLNPETFEATYLNYTGTGSPCHFTVLNRVLYLGPTPSASAMFALGYRRQIAHDDGSGTVVAGNLDLDTDAPLWTQDHDEILVAGGRARGKRRAQDPTWQADIMERDELLAALVIDFSPSNTAKPDYPRDPL